MISRYFINHPIFASVISLIITFAGLVAMRNLPVEQYPNITPPLIQVTTNYNGANADTMANDVASPLEQQILGVQNMIYMYSQNSSTGTMTLDIYFAIGSNADMAQVNVQNQVSQALAQLPEEVQKEGVTITKQTPNILLIVALQSPDGRYDQTFVSNFANINVVNDLQLLPGISNISVIGQRNYAMRIWLRPDLMAQMKISSNDIVEAVKEQNADFGLGQLGQEPNIRPVPLTIPFSTQGRLTTPEQFENIILRADLNGSMVLLKDVASVTLGAQDYTVDGELDGKSTILLAVYQEYGANALQVSQSIHREMEKISKNFPAGISYSIPYDSTLFIKASIQEVFRTILEAALLVMLVVFLFLQKWRATLIPVMALIVSIIGTFAGMYLLGYSINMLTLFGMVLAIGIVVDDAIVVVENVERNMRDLGLAPKEAALKAMEEVTAPIIAIVFVLCAVFVPVAFLGGIAGQLYRQFAMTIAISVCVSGLVALTLSPAIAAMLLKPEEPFKWAIKFNRRFGQLTEGYLFLTRKLIAQKMVGLGIFAALLLGIAYLFIRTPTSFVPDEDQGYIIAISNLPDASSLDRTVRVDQKIEQIAIKHPGVQHVVSLTGFSLIESLDRTTIGTNFIILKDWKERKKKNLHADQIIQDLNREFFGAIQDAAVIALNPPAIQGLGTVGGFEFWLENELIEKAKHYPALSSLRTTAQFNNLQFFVDLDRYKCRMLGVGINDVFQALQTLIGSVYVNNFNKFGRVYQVIVQAEPAYREKLTKDLPADISYGWSGAAYQQIATGGTSFGVFVAALLMVFLILAALYEKWSAPLAILMAVPFGIFGALVAITVKGMPNDVYFQIGLVTLIALSAKNAILIVEFAILKHKEGMDIVEAAIEAARLRFRAIIMTSLTFIFGVVPLVISTGAGAASRHSVGVSVMGGVISATTLALFFVPLFFLLLCREKRCG